MEGYIQVPRSVFFTIAEDSCGRVDAVMQRNERLTPLIGATGFCVLASAAMWPWLARAQLAPAPVAPATATATMSTGDGPRCRSAIVLGAGAAWRGAAVTLLPAPVSAANRYGAATPSVAIDAHSSTNRPWIVSVAASLGRAESDCVSLSSRSRAYAQLAHVSTKRGLALALGARSLSAMDPTQDREGVTLSLWQRWHAGQIGIAVRGHDAFASQSRITDTTVYRRAFDPGRPLDTGTVQPLRIAKTSVSRVRTQAFDVRTDGQLFRGRLTLDVSLGGTFGRDGAIISSLADSLLASSRSSTRNASWQAQLWARTQLRVRVSSYLDFGFGLAALPTQPALGSPTRGVASFAVGFARRAIAPDSLEGARKALDRFAATRDDSGVVNISIQLPKAKHVMLSGDLTHWRPLPMTQRAGGWWDVRLKAKPGTYRVNISIDGAGWTLPPGVPAQRDEFGGLVGVITVR